MADFDPKEIVSQCAEDTAKSRALAANIIRQYNGHTETQIMMAQSHAIAVFMLATLNKEAYVPFLETFA
jgi:hypothetical protein